MSGSRPTPVEQHLGDRLAALVDGELGHDSRERVLAHLATCAKCKAEADAQRRLKNVFAEAAPPPPSESFLARLQGLPGGGDSDDDGGLPSTGGMFGRGIFGMTPDPFTYAPAGPHAPVLPAAERGFRIHSVGRSDAERSAARGRRRFAFAAAGAVSLAAIALGGVSTSFPAETGGAARGAGSDNVTPMRTQGAGAVPSSDASRRRTTSPMLGQRSGGALAAPVAPTSVTAPLLPGAPTPMPSGEIANAVRALAAPMLAGAAATSPLIRSLPDVTSATFSSAPSGLTALDGPLPGLLSAPVTGAAPSPGGATASPVR
ncbi:anti-sigma factor family protein [Streptomyces sp. NPDC058001]|uniref:anti-sigma factor family protein n=1 Tax=Streptomyces sp. NPDC058001 TaxID=3346300 RepID=UPI0036E4AE14